MTLTLGKSSLKNNVRAVVTTDTTASLVQENLTPITGTSISFPSNRNCAMSPGVNHTFAIVTNAVIKAGTTNVLQITVLFSGVAKSYEITFPLGTVPNSKSVISLQLKTAALDFYLYTQDASFQTKFWYSTAGHPSSGSIFTSTASEISHSLSYVNDSKFEVRSNLPLSNKNEIIFSFSTSEALPTRVINNLITIGQSIVVIGDSGFIAVSDIDNNQFFDVSLPSVTGNFLKFVETPTELFAVTTNGSFVKAAKTNLKQWTFIAQVGYTIEDFIFNGTTFYAGTSGGGTSQTANVLLVSSDCITWTPRVLPLENGFAHTPRRLFWDSSISTLLLATDVQTTVSATPKIYSTVNDGVSFTQLASFSTTLYRQARAISKISGVYVAAYVYGPASSFKNGIFTSTDLVTWNAQLVGTYEFRNCLNDGTNLILYGGDPLVAGRKQISFTTNGTSYTSVSGGPGSTIRFMTKTNDLFVTQKYFAGMGETTRYRESSDFLADSWATVFMSAQNYASRWLILTSGLQVKSNSRGHSSADSPVYPLQDRTGLLTESSGTSISRDFFFAEGFNNDVYIFGNRRIWRLTNLSEPVLTTLKVSLPSSDYTGAISLGNEIWSKSSTGNNLIMRTKLVVEDDPTEVFSDFCGFSNNGIPAIFLSKSLTNSRSTITLRE